MVEVSTIGFERPRGAMLAYIRARHAEWSVAAFHRAREQRRVDDARLAEQDRAVARAVAEAKLPVPATETASSESPELDSIFGHPVLRRSSESPELDSMPEGHPVLRRSSGASSTPPDFLRPKSKPVRFRAPPNPTVERLKKKRKKRKKQTQ